MSGIDPYISIIIALLGLAYPILLQVISRLDEKYESENIAVLFKTEWEWKAFKLTLVTSLVAVFLWSLKLKPLVNIQGLNFIIKNSAILLIGINTVLLVVSFFLFASKVLKYYTPYSLVPYLIGCHEKSKSDIKFIPALTDLLLLSIKKQQTNLSRTLSDFFYKAFRDIRDNFSNEPVVYPDIYYETVYKAIEELAILKEKRNYLLEHRTSGEIWFLGELQGKEISEKTYSWMWRNILLAIRYQQDDLIFNHWQTCHQYYSYNLPYINEEYTSTGGVLQVSNQETVEKRSSERQRFIEFHYTLGGLLIYSEKYTCIKRMFTYTQSQPPKYELLPESMDEIFKFYSNIRDPYEEKYSWISHQYPFPELSGLSADHVIKKWIMSYMAVLFLRQYTIRPYLTTMKPLNFPSIPKTQSQIKKWIDGLDFFKKLVSEHLENEKLLKALDLDVITHQWCKENEKPYPIEFIEKFKTTLEGEYKINAQTLTISDEKVSKFEDSTKKIIESTIEASKRINNMTAIQDNDSDKWYINGTRSLYSKDAFSENPEADHLNFDSFFANSIAKKLSYCLANTFFYKMTKSYLLKDDDFFKAIDKLEIDDSFVIINFGINLDYYINHLKVSELSKDKYKNIEIFSFIGSKLSRDSFFVLKKSDLPNISSKPIEEDFVKQYSLKKVSDINNLYASVIDLNKASEDVYQEVYEEVKQGKSEEDLKKSVLLNIIVLMEFKWKKNIEVIQLKQYSEYLQKGITNKLGDVKPF